MAKRQMFESKNYASEENALKAVEKSPFEAIRDEHGKELTYYIAYQGGRFYPVFRLRSEQMHFAHPIAVYGFTVTN